MVLSQFWIDLIGYVGSSAVALSAPLQLRKSWKRESTGDISWKWISSYLLGICLIFVYAVIENLPPVWGPICLEISCSGMLLLLKIKYDLIQQKTYTAEMSTQTEFEEMIEPASLKALSIDGVAAATATNSQEVVDIKVTGEEVGVV